MKNPNAPLMAPDLVSGRVQVANGHDTVDNNGGGDYNSSAALKSSDFKSINSREHSLMTSCKITQPFTEDTVPHRAGHLVCREVLLELQGAAWAVGRR